MAADKRVKDFDTVLVQAIHETIEYCLGQGNAAVIEKYLDGKGLPINEIPARPEQF